MAYKCRICGVNEVDHQGDICELCAISQDPYAQNQVPVSNTPVFSQPHTSEHPDGNSSYAPKRGANRKVLLNGGASLANRDPYGNDMTVSAP